MHAIPLAILYATTHATACAQCMHAIPLAILYATTHATACAQCMHALPLAILYATTHATACAHFAGFDGFYTYFATDGMTYGSTQR
jgi:hypothetical protein